MKFVYSLIILALGLSQFTAMGRSAVRSFKPNVTQNLIRGISPNHPAYSSLARLNRATADLKESQVCRARTMQCEAFGNRIFGVFNVLHTANSNVGQNHLAGVIAGKSREIANEWEAPAQEGAGVFLDGFVGTRSPSLSFRTNKAVEGLLKDHLGVDLSGRQMTQAVRDKKVELEQNCRS